MRRSELVKAIDTVLSAVRESGLLAFIKAEAERAHGERHSPQRDPGEGGKILQVFRSYAVAADRFSPVERKLAAAARLDPLEQPSLWAAVLEHAQIVGLFEPAVQGVDALATFRELLALKPIAPLPQTTEQPTKSLERLSIEVVEEEGRLSRPSRLIKVLQGVSSIYEAHSTLLSLPAESLLVEFCDSGSNKSFDLLGITQAINALRETIISLWDRIVFFRERKVLFNMRLVAEALPVLAQISSLAEANAIPPEQAEILRRQVVEGATMLGEAGAIIPDMDMRPKPEIRAFAAPEPKLLAAPSTTVTVQGQAPAPPKPKRTRKGKRAA